MSYSKGITNHFKFNEKSEKNSEFNDTKVISYIECNNKSKEFYEAMKMGYEEMAIINQEYAESSAMSDYYSFVEYETWLFGV